MKNFKDLKIGDIIKVTNVIDDCGNADYIGKTGKIKRFNSSGEEGEDENDPLITIIFADGEIESYWYEEVILIRRSRKLIKVDLPIENQENVFYSLLIEQNLLEQRKRKLDYTYKRKVQQVHNQFIKDNIALEYSENMLSLAITQEQLNEMLLPYLN